MAAHAAVRIVDDLDGSNGAKTVAFALDGAGYEINLSSKNANALHQAFAPFVAAGRRVGSSRVTGAERARQYNKGRSVRELADAHGRSYGFVHQVLAESGVALRGRGGANRGKAGKK